MKLEAIIHRSTVPDCYALNEDEIVINLRTGKEVECVNIIHADPYIDAYYGIEKWKGEPSAMNISKELKYHNIWSIKISPKFKREQYYFELFSEDEHIFMLEDGFYTKEQLETPGIMMQYFKFAWLNSSDVIKVPEWVSDVVWYQIMPDTFCSAGNGEKRIKCRDWSNKNNHWKDFFGGDLKGITKKLDYLVDLGISGIYLTPVFESPSNHKYNTSDYLKIDPDFGSDEDMVKFVEIAHSKGIKIMLDAVFNHSGTDFFAWQDVLKNGKSSKYADWYFLNSFPLDTGDYKTCDGRFYSFAFYAGMPKLNTNNSEVQKYFIEICKTWIKKWNIDGIRFDVGNEISHNFLKRMNSELKCVKDDIFLLGEIWLDSLAWLLGDEYDSVMNYPFIESINNFWIDKNESSLDFIFAINRVYSLYARQTNSALFNFLDTHDTSRVRLHCKSDDVFFQQLAVLMTMQGSACIYYGTEIAMGKNGEVFNRMCMPWQEIESGLHDKTLSEVKELISLRNKNAACKAHKIEWDKTYSASRLIHYTKIAKNGKRLSVYINADSKDFEIKEDMTLVYKRNFLDGVLKAGGIAIFE